MTDWEADPGLAEIRQEFIDSFSLRLANLKILNSRLVSGSITREDTFAIQILVHKLAGSAESYGFPILTRISGAIDELISVDKILPAEILCRSLRFLEEALTQAVERREDPVGFTNDPRMHELTSAVGVPPD